MNKPKYLKKKHLEYLDALRESGITNIYGATPYLQDEYLNLEKREASEILQYWMDTFSERHKTV